METKIFMDLPKDAIDIRKKVFMEEQGFEEEFDNIDSKATHIVVYDEMKAIGTCRVYYSEENGSFMIGRIAVRSEYRGKRIGEMIVKEAESYIAQKGERKAMLSAQKRARGFYEKMSYESTGHETDDEGCPHIMMKKEW